MQQKQVLSGKDPIQDRPSTTGASLLGTALAHSLGDALVQVDQLLMLGEAGHGEISVSRLRFVRERLWQVHDVAAGAIRSAGRFA